MGARRSRWYAAVLVLPSKGFDVEEGMSSCQGVVVMMPDAEVAPFSTQGMSSPV